MGPSMSIADRAFLPTKAVRDVDVWGERRNLGEGPRTEPVSGPAGKATPRRAKNGPRTDERGLAACRVQLGPHANQEARGGGTGPLGNLVGRKHLGSGRVQRQPLLGLG